MDRDNPFGSSYLREGATRVQKPRLTFRQTEPAMPVAHGHTSDHSGPSGPVVTKRAPPHLRLQRRLSLTSDTSTKPAIADDESEADYASPPSLPRNDARRNSASMSARSNGSTGTRRSSNANSNRSRVVRPADHSRPTVHFTSGRSGVLLTLPAPSQAPNGHEHDQGNRFPDLPVAPTSTALSRRPSNRNSAPVFNTNNSSTNHYPRQPVYDSVYGSTVGSMSTNQHNYGAGSNSNGKKTVTFDSSETEDSFSCLSNSTQATSVDERDQYDHGYCDYLPGDKKSMAAQPTTTVTFDCPEHSSRPSQSTVSSSTATMSPPTRPQPTRRRSQSFSGSISGSIDREMLHGESNLVHIPKRRSISIRDSYSHVPARDVPAPSSVSSTASYDKDIDIDTEKGSSRTDKDRDKDKNTQAQFEAHKVALEAQFEQRQLALEAERKKLAVELEEAMTALGDAQAERNNLRHEVVEHRKRVKALEDEVDGLHESNEKSLQLRKTEAQEIQELRADLEASRAALDKVTAELADASQAIADANVAVATVRQSLKEEEATCSLFREGKNAFESRCSDLEAKCKDLEEQVVAARDANKELHVLMAAQITDLTATKEALQVRIGVLEEEEANRVAATAAAVAAAAAAEEKAANDAKAFGEEKTGLEEKLAAADKKCAALETDNEASKTEVADLKGQVETLTADLDKAKEENATHQEAIAGHEAAVDKARQEAEEAATKAATEAADALKETIAKLEEAHAALTTELDALKADAGKDKEAGGEGNAAAPDSELQEKHASLEAAHKELQEKLEALEATLAAEKAEKEGTAASLTAAKEEAATALASLTAAQEEAATAKAEAATSTAQSAQLPELTQQNTHLANELAAFNERMQELRAAYATSEAEGMALRDQLAKMRGKLASVAGSVTSTSSKKSTKKNKDDLVIVRTPGDRGRFQVMRKSDLHRSPSRSSRKTDYDST